MPKPTIERHGASFRVTITIPKDVQHAFDKPYLRESIRVADRALAESFAYRFAASCNDKFIRIRQGLPAEPEDPQISEAEARYWAHEWTRRLLESDEAVRVLGDWLIAQSEASVDAEPLHLTDLLDDNEACLRKALIFGELDQRLIARAEQAAEELGISLRPGSAVFRVFAVHLADNWQRALKVMLKRSGGQLVETPKPQPAPTKTLGAIVSEFIERQERLKADSAMLGKYRSILPEMVEYIGDKPCDELKQNDFLTFGDDLCQLPPNWKDLRAKGHSLRELAVQDHDVCIAKATFERSYKAAIGAFLRYAQSRYGDDGFPSHISAEGMEYIGRRTDPERNQRPMKSDELRRLFEGAEMKAFAADPKQAHCYWLPHIGLYTGARVREVCQLNPQTDIRQDDGVWFFDITEDGEAAEGVTKSAKTVSSRRHVPIHPVLLDLGFLDYLGKLKKSGARQLFPEWKPKGGDAAGHAAEWFRDFITEIGLRDETPGAMLIGYHSFRHTFLTRAKRLGISERHLITGHAPTGVSKAQRGYEWSAPPLSDLQAVVNRVSYDLTHVVVRHT